MTVDMTDPTVHLRDDQLLLHASGELREASAESASRHMESCLRCKARLAELEGALDELTQAHRIAFDSTLPSAAGPRALLRAQLSNLSACEGSKHEHPNGAAGAALIWGRGIVFAAMMLVVMFLANLFWRETENAPTQTASLSLSSSSLPEEPDARFTPGAVITMSQNQVCSNAVETPAIVPIALKNKVLQLYGVASGQSDAYEVDYLITPALGGATDIRNLWPEPYDHTVWNAHVKDRLEDRLRELVCHGDLDLATAQHDISTDWIAAYRKYFHADAPQLSGSS